MTIAGNVLPSGASGFNCSPAFSGLMTALERRLGPDSGIAFHGAGVVCHAFEPQVSGNGYTRTFHLTRNPVLHDGSTAAIVEEGRVHLELTLVFDVELTAGLLGENERAQLATRIGEMLAGIRIAGGSVMPPLAGRFRTPPRPQLVLVPDDPEAKRKQFRKLSRQWLPGFALVSRDDLLQQRLEQMRSVAPGTTLLDAWLDLSRLNYHATRQTAVNQENGEIIETAEWTADSQPGWLVPMPVGFAALSELHAPGTVGGTRDPDLPLRFVESIYSIGQWVSPHRLTGPDQILWRPFHDDAIGLYRCITGFPFAPVPASELI